MVGASSNRSFKWYYLLAGVLLVVAWLVIPSGLIPDELSEVMDVAFERHQDVWEACTAYSAEHNGSYPPSLDVLVRNDYLDGDALSFEGWGGGRVSILYSRPRAKAVDETPLLRDSRPTYVRNWRLSYGKYDDLRHKEGFVLTTTVAGDSEYIPSATPPKGQK